MARGIKIINATNGNLKKILYRVRGAQNNPKIKGFDIRVDSIGGEIPNEPQRRYLVFSRFIWQQARNGAGYNFTDKELDNAQPDGFIGHQNGVDCYLQKPFE